jgi:hypothetical protein
MEKQIAELMNEYKYFNISGGALYWRTGKTSERILVSDIDSIEFFTDKAVLKSEKGTDFGYHEVVFTASGAAFTETLDNVVYYN